MAYKGGGGQQDDTHLGAFLIIGIMIFASLGYYMFHQQIIGAMFYIKGLELEAISYFLPHYESLTLWMKGVPLNKVTFNDLRALAVDVGEPLQWPLIIITLVMTVIGYKFHPDIGFRNTESMKTLKEKMRNTFPCLKIIDGLDLVNEPLNQGPWAMALTPVEFAKQHKLIARDPATKQVVLNKAKAKLIFVAQLGRPWKGTEDLNAYERAMFGILAAYINYKRGLAEETLENICMSMTPDKMKSGNIDFSEAEKLFEKYADTAEVKAVTEKHAYVLTVLSAMLVQARTTGIVANSIYLWIKPIDRRLWYVLNNVGRRAVFAEASGVRAHLLAETALGAPIGMPMVEEAVSALQEAINSRIIKDI